MSNIKGYEAKREEKGKEKRQHDLKNLPGTNTLAYLPSACVSNIKVLYNLLPDLKQKSEEKGREKRQLYLIRKFWQKKRKKEGASKLSVVQSVNKGIRRVGGK